MPILMTRNRTVPRQVHGYGASLVGGGQGIHTVDLPGATPDVEYAPEDDVRWADPSVQYGPPADVDSGGDPYVGGEQGYPTVYGPSSLPMSLPDSIELPADIGGKATRVAALLTIPFFAYIAFQKDLPLVARLFAGYLGYRAWQTGGVVYTQAEVEQAVAQAQGMIPGGSYSGLIVNARKRGPYNGCGGGCGCAGCR